MSSNSRTLAPAPRPEAAERVRLEVREFLAAELAAGSSETHANSWELLAADAAPWPALTRAL